MRIGFQYGGHTWMTNQRFAVIGRFDEKSTNRGPVWNRAFRSTRNCM